MFFFFFKRDLLSLLAFGALFCAQNPFMARMPLLTLSSSFLRFFVAAIIYPFVLQLDILLFFFVSPFICCISSTSKTFFFLPEINPKRYVAINVSPFICCISSTSKTIFFSYQINPKRYVAINSLSGKVKRIEEEYISPKKRRFSLIKGETHSCKESQ